MTRAPHRHRPAESVGTRWWVPPVGWPIVLAGAAVALTALWPWQMAWPWVITVLIALGVPHGALDGEIARTLLRPTFGRFWFGAFAVPYLMLFTGVLVAWHLAPTGTLAAFLAASVWHFGAEDAPNGDTLSVLAQGGLPIALPVLVHPQATVLILSATVQQGVTDIPAWLHMASLLWLLVVVVWVLRTIGRRATWPWPLWQVTALVVLFVVLPPLQAFVVYFVCVHAPRHTAALIGCDRRAPRVHDQRSAWLLALPITALTIGIGVLLWPLYGGPPAARLLGVTLQTLAALTLPHMLLDAFASRHLKVVAVA